MLRWSLPPSGILDERIFPFSVILPSVQVAAPPAEVAAGDVGPVGLEAFLFWISWTCFGSETASDWETNMWCVMGVIGWKERPVSKRWTSGRQTEISVQLKWEVGENCCSCFRDSRNFKNRGTNRTEKDVFFLQKDLPYRLFSLQGCLPLRCAGGAKCADFYDGWTHGTNL